MAKMDLTKGFKKPAENRRKLAADATTFMLGGIDISNMTDEIAKLMVKSIPISKIRARNVNEFAEVDITGLAESIRHVGLINPLSVVHHPDEDVYVISSGHRRFKAITLLHEEYPNVEEFSSIDCAVYEITDDDFKLKQGLPYITAEQENEIYRDSNLESRQLSYSDVAHQIGYIVDRLEDPDYQKRLVERTEAVSGKGTYQKPDRVRLIVEALAQQNYSGWKAETIRRYLKVKDANRTDLLEKIERSEITVKAAYTEVINATKHARVRKTNKISAVKKSLKDLEKEASARSYTEAEVKELQKCIEQLQKIVEANKAS